MMSERISEDNPPVDIKSPMRLKKDVDDLEKNFTDQSAEDESGSGEGEEASSEESGGEEGGEEVEEAEPAKEAETPTFGLGS